MMVSFSARISVISDCCDCFYFAISLEFTEQWLFWIIMRDAVFRSAPYRFPCYKNMHGAWLAVAWVGVRGSRSTQRDSGAANGLQSKADKVDGDGMGRDGTAVTI